MKKHPYKIGDKIKFSAAYPRNVTKRFRKPFSQDWRTDRNPHPLYANPKEGYVIGIRSVYMSNYEAGRWEEDDGFIFGSGTKETVLLVTEGMTREPFLVRFTDVLPNEATP